MATIRIAETVHPSHAARMDTDAASTGVSDGGHNMRAFSRTPTREHDGIYNMRSLSRTSSRDKRSLKGTDKEAEDDDPGLRQSGDYKTRQVQKGFSHICFGHTPHAD